MYIQTYSYTFIRFHFYIHLYPYTMIFKDVQTHIFYIQMHTYSFLCMYMHICTYVYLALQIHKCKYMDIHLYLPSYQLCSPKMQMFITYTHIYIIYFNVYIQVYINIQICAFSFTAIYTDIQFLDPFFNLSTAKTKAMTLVEEAMFVHVCVPKNVDTTDLGPQVLVANFSYICNTNPSIFVELS